MSQVIPVLEQLGHTSFSLKFLKMLSASASLTDGITYVQLSDLSCGGLNLSANVATCDPVRKAISTIRTAMGSRVESDELDAIATAAKSPVHSPESIVFSGVVTSSSSFSERLDTF